MKGVDELVSEYQAARQVLGDRIKTSLMDILKPFFDKDENLKEVIWCQYTPYFNDGEECIFGVNFWDIENKELREALSKIPDEIFQDAFGDHVEVKIQRDGKMLVRDYEHE